MEDLLRKERGKTSRKKEIIDRNKIIPLTAPVPPLFLSFLLDFLISLMSFSLLFFLKSLYKYRESQGIYDF